MGVTLHPSIWKESIGPHERTLRSKTGCDLQIENGDE